jgi:predicted nuclease of predicted toxin-antitoxin system
MRFKIDENLPAEAAKLLRHSGYDAATVPEQHLGGSADHVIASICQQENRVLVTLDMDFADIRTYPPGDFPGMVVLRLRRHDKPYVLEILARLIELFPREPLDRHLWIVEERRIRIRGNGSN